MSQIHHNDSSIDLHMLLDYVEGKVDAAKKEKIGQYLETHAIEKEMVEGMQAYYEEYGPSREEMLAFLEKSQKRTVNKVMERHQQLHQKRNQRFLLQKRLSVAAMILVTFGIVLYLLLPSTSTENILVSEYLSTPYPVGNLVRSQGTTDDWVTAYSQQNYQEASIYLEELLQNHPDSVALRFAAGLSYLYQPSPNPTASIAHLERIKANVMYGEQAKWFLALAYLLNEQQTPAKELLNDITTHQTYQYRHAQELLFELKQ